MGIAETGRAMFRLRSRLYAREREKHAIMMRHERLRVAPTSKNIDDPNILMKINTVVASW